MCRQYPSEVKSVKSTPMKNLVIILSFITLLGCRQDDSRVVITGRVIGDIPSEIYYTVPVNETVFQWRFVSSVQPDTSGCFQIETHVKKPAFIKILLGNEPSIIAEPGKAYSLVISQNDNEEYYTEFHDYNREVFAMYNDLDRINPAYCSWLDKVPKNQEAIDSIQTRYRDEQTLIDSVLGHFEVNPQVAGLIKTDRKLYYALAQSITSSGLFTQYLYQDSIFDDDAFLMWQNAVTSFPVDNPKIIQLNFAHEFLNNYFWFAVYTRMELDEFMKESGARRKENRYYSYQMQLAEDIFEDDLLEFFMATFVCFRSDQIVGQPDDFVNIIRNFRQKFPRSPYEQFMDPVYRNALAMMDDGESQ